MEKRGDVNRRKWNNKDQAGNWLKHSKLET